MRNLVLAALAAPSLAFAEPSLLIDLGGEVEGQITIELDSENAPGHAERLVALARSGEYDGIAFHRVIDGFMAQTGDVQFGRIDSYDPRRAGRGGSDLPNLDAEFGGEFTRGAVGMARAADQNSANSQFFIMFDEAPYLNGQYTVVGYVTEGMELVDQIAKGDQARNGTVDEPDFMETVTVVE